MHIVEEGGLTTAASTYAYSECHDVAISLLIVSLRHVMEVHYPSWLVRWEMMVKVNMVTQFFLAPNFVLDSLKTRQTRTCKRKANKSSYQQQTILSVVSLAAICHDDEYA